MLGFFRNVAEKLNMQPDDAERWIVNLIRNARLDAKIDAKQVSAVFVYSQLWGVWGL